MTIAVALPELPGSLKMNRRLSQWLAIHPDGTVWVYSGKVEFGQGIGTALAQIAAREMDVAVSRIRLVAASTSAGPNEGVTAGSLSVQDSGGALRQVCAEARAIYLQAAARQIGLSAGQIHTLEVVDGQIGIRGDRAGPATSYWALANAALLDCEATGEAAPRDAAVQALGVAAVPRLDLPDKISGRPRFIHDMRLPGMVFGRVVHPPSPGAVLLDVDLAAVQALRGVVTTVRDGSFLGVIADSEYSAVRAADELAGTAQWRALSALPDMHD